MKLFSKARLLVWVLIALAFGGERAAAVVVTAPPSGGSVTTNGFRLTVAYPNEYFYINTTATNFIVVSNGTGFLLTDVYVTNEFSSAVDYLYAGIETNENISYFTANTNGSSLIFNFEVLPAHALATNYFIWHPTVAGELTNTVIVSSGDEGVTNRARLVLARPVYAASSEVVVSDGILSQAYITNGSWFVTNDWITYGVTVSNAGPGTATGLTLTNTLPAGTTLVAGSSLNSVGTLTNHGIARYKFIVLASTNGLFTLTDTVGIPATLVDPATGSATTSKELLITNAVVGALLARTISGQVVNLQNGLLEQTIVVTNTNSISVQGVRVVVSGLGRQLYNASGTNHGQPYVEYPQPLAPGDSVTLRLQYNPRTAFKFANSQLHAYGVPGSVLHYTPPPGAEFSTNSIEFKRPPLLLTNGDMLLEFGSLDDASLTVVYSTNMDFSNPMIATPAVSSSASAIQWLDYGPPGTVSAPVKSSSRYYRVLVNPKF